MLWRPDGHEPLVDRPWDEDAARRAIEVIVGDAVAAETDAWWPGHPHDGAESEERLTSLYLGSAGTIWALSRLRAAFDAAGAIATAIQRYRAMPDFGDEAHPPSLWMGETGLLTVAGALGAPAADPTRVGELIRTNRRHPTWDLMWGSPGTMLSARASGLDDEWLDSAEALWENWDEGSDLWTQELYGSRHQYLGPAHGLAGNVHSLRGYVSPDVLRDRVQRVLERHALRAGDLANWLPRVGAPPESLRVQWCHGAPGIITTVGDLLTEDLLHAAGELVWQAGPLAKGSGLCHGTAGNGFALLKLHELTGEERWLERGRRFAMHAIEQVEQVQRRVGRGRFALWTGDLGVALYLSACIEVRADFPTIDRF